MQRLRLRSIRDELGDEAGGGGGAGDVEPTKEAVGEAIMMAGFDESKDPKQVSRASVYTHVNTAVHGYMGIWVYGVHTCSTRVVHG